MIKIKSIAAQTTSINVLNRWSSRKEKEMNRCSYIRQLPEDS